MSAHRSGIQLTADEQIEIFGTTAFSVEYTDEAEELWGDTEAWKQSQQGSRRSPSRTGWASRPTVTRC